MTELYYHPYSIAGFIVTQDIGVKEQMQLIERIFEEEKEYIDPANRENKSDFFSDVMYLCDYLSNTEEMEKEQVLVINDVSDAGITFDEDKNVSLFPKIDIYFSYLRLKLKYCSGQNYVRIKLKTLLKAYGYKRRSKQLMNHIQECMDFYQIKSFIRGGEKCDLRSISIEDMIIFRLKEEY